MAKVPNAVEILPKITTTSVGCTIVTDRRQQIAKFTFAKNLTANQKKPTVENAATDLRVVLLGPLNTIKQVAEIRLDWNVMLVWLQLLVEELVVRRVLLQHNRVTGKQVRKSICRDRPINTHLVLVLTRTSSLPSVFIWLLRLHSAFLSEVTLV